MPPAPKPLNEADRLRVLRQYDILDTEPEKGFDDIAVIAASICRTPIALVSLVDEERQWFKACVGLGVSETHRDSAFCAHTILNPQPLVVEDATLDPRFVDNPLVTGEPYIRCYVGAPLITPGGHQLGSMCVIDQEPRTMDSEQLEALEALARQVVSLLELRRVSADLAEAMSQVKLLAGLVPICAYCHQIRDDQDFWTQMQNYVTERTGAEFTHGICPACEEEQIASMQA